MIYDDLERLVGYGMTIIECYNEEKQLEYIIDLNEMQFFDIDVVLSTRSSPIGIIKLIRNAEHKTEEESI